MHFPNIKHINVVAHQHFTFSYQVKTISDMYIKSTIKKKQQQFEISKILSFVELLLFEFHDKRSQFYIQPCWHQWLHLPWIMIRKF